jgi:hypothetical protein
MPQPGTARSFEAQDQLRELLEEQDQRTDKGLWLKTYLSPLHRKHQPNKTHPQLKQRLKIQHQTDILTFLGLPRPF